MSGIDDQRVVLAIDAASISSRVSVARDGTVKGLLSKKFTANANKILSTSIEFANFVKENESDIIKYYFIVYVCPLSPMAKGFPIALIPRKAGNANKEVVEKFIEIIEKVNDKIPVVGVAFDGDPGWLHLAKEVAICTKESLLNSILTEEELKSLNRYVFLNDEDHPDQPPFLIFEDMLHLLKCFRYRLCCGCSLCPSLFSDDNNFINKENFQSVGIPSWILDEAKYLKMDDGMPLRLFTHENIEKCVYSGRIDLAYALIPCTLLNYAMMKKKIDRSSRIEMISIAYSIVFLYLCELEQYSGHKKERLQTTSKSAGKGKYVTLMDKKWCYKFLSLCQSVICVLFDPQAVDLGSLGSHWLEHFFGQVRQLSKGNDTYERFEECVYNSILSNILEQEIGIKLISPKRVSSSGATIEETENVIACDLSLPLHIAFELHQSISTGVFCDILFEKISQIDVDFDSDAIEYILLLLRLEEKTPTIRTTVSERLAIATCKTQQKNLSLSSQLQNLSSKKSEKSDDLLPKQKAKRRSSRLLERELNLLSQSQNSSIKEKNESIINQNFQCNDLQNEMIDQDLYDSLLQSTIPQEITTLLVEEFEIKSVNDEKINPFITRSDNDNNFGS